MVVYSTLCTCKTASCLCSFFICLVKSCSISLARLSPQLYIEVFWCQLFTRAVLILYFCSEHTPEKLFILLECGETDLSVYLKKRLHDKSLNRMKRCVFWHDMLQAVQVLHKQGMTELSSLFCIAFCNPRKIDIYFQLSNSQ